MSIVLPAGISYTFIFELLGTDGLPIDLTDCSSLTVKFRKLSEATPIEITGISDDPTTGVFSGSVTALQTEDTGGWSVWGVARWASGRVIKTHGTSIMIIAEGAAYSG